MNSDEIIDELLSTNVEYDKNKVTVESVLKDLDNLDVDLSNLINNSSENEKEEKKEKKESVKDENVEKVNESIKEETKEKPKGDDDDLLNKILNEKIDDILKDEILKEEKKGQMKEENEIDEIIREKKKDVSKVELEEDNINKIIKNENAEIKNEIENEIKNNLKNITKDEIDENQKEDIKEIKKEDIKNGDKNKDKNEVKKEDAKKGVKNNINDNIKQGKKEEKKEDIKNDIKKGIKEDKDKNENIKEEEKENIKEEKKEEKKKEEIKEEEKEEEKSDGLKEEEIKEIKDDEKEEINEEKKEEEKEEEKEKEIKGKIKEETEEEETEEEKKEDIKEDIKKDIKEEEKSENIKEEKKEDIKEEKKDIKVEESIKENEKDRIKEVKNNEIKDKVKEVINDNVEDTNDFINRDIKEEKKEDIKLSIKEHPKENIEENIKKNIEENAKNEIKEDNLTNTLNEEMTEKKENKDDELKDILNKDIKDIINVEITKEEYINNILNEENIIETEDYNLQKKELEKELQLLEKQREEKTQKELEIKRKEEEEKRIKKQKEEEEKRRKKKEEERIKKQKEEEEKERQRREEEEKINKKKEEQKKKLESFIPQFPNPLDFIQYIEILRVNTKISGEMHNFLLKNHIKKNNKYNVSVISSLYEISKILSKEDVNLIFSKRDLLIACTLKGEIFSFSMDTQKLINRILPKNIKSQNINCVDVTEDLQDAICGYQDGTIALINVNTGEIKYTTNKIHKDVSCLEIKIYKKEKENEISFISSGENGQLFYNNFKKTIFWKLNSVLILKNNSPIFLIKFVTFSMKNHHYYQNLNCLKKFVLFGSLQEIKFYCIEPKIEQIFEVKKPSHIRGNLVPDAQIGIGRMPEIFMRFKKTDVKNHLLMAISWGNIIYFYQLPIINGIAIKEYKEIGYYINMFDIIRIGFLNSSVIFCLDKAFSIKILDTSKISTGKIKFSGIKPEIPKNNDFAEIEKNRHICEYISNQKKIGDCETYLYSIIDNNSSLQIIGDKQIFCYNLVDWDILLKEFQKKKDYLNLFSVGINLYYGKMLSFSNIPERKLLKRTVGNFLKDIIIKYIDLTIGKKKSDIKEPIELQKINECINITIEFFIEIDSVEFLLRSIEPLFEEKEYGPLFFSKLEPIILCDRAMKSILPSDIVLNLIDLYNKNDKLEIISQLLLHMNLITLDNPEIIEKLEELNLFIPLIYLYHNGKNEDYFIPLQKMFDFYTTKLKWIDILINNEDNYINYSNALTKKLLSLKEVYNSKEYNCHRILWYIKWCLTGKKFPDNTIKMKEELFNVLVPKIAYWLINENVISELLNFDPKNYFNIYKNIFLIKSLYNKIVDSANNESMKKKFMTSLSENGVKIDDIQPLTLINYLINWCKQKNNNKIFFYLYDMIIAISKNSDVKIEKQLRIESACFILQNYRQTIKIINNQEVESLIVVLIDFLKDEMFNNDDYKQILSSMVDNIFDELKLFVLKKIEDYKSCLELFIDENSKIKDKDKEVYKWIFNLIDNTNNKESKQYKEFIESIRENALTLIEISMPDFIKIERHIFKNKKDIVKKLEKNKDIQLNYIKEIIKSFIKSKEEIDDEDEEKKSILILHIKLLCELNKLDEIVPAFKMYSYYPFEECLAICEKVKAYDALVFLYIKGGAIEKAFDLSIEKLDNIFHKLLENIKTENNEEEHKILLEMFEKYFLDAKNTCENKYINIENLWFKCLDILYKYEIDSSELTKQFEKDDKRNHNSEELYQTILQDIKEFMERMYSFVSIKRILEVVTDKNKNYGITGYKDILLKILNAYSNSTNMLFSIRHLLINLVFQSQQTFQDCNLKGKILNNKCDKCKKYFNDEINYKKKIFRFNCNHTFHKECISISNTKLGKEAICPICQIFEFDKKTPKGISLVKDDYNIIEEESEKSKKDTFSINRIYQKLEKYDKRYTEKNESLIRNCASLIQK